MLESLFAALGYGLCHQLPERSLFAGGFQLPVCARDTGIYLGFVAALLVLAVMARGRRPMDLPRWPVLLGVVAFVGAMAVDGITSYAGLRATTNDLRLITGLLAGWAMGTLTLPMINSQFWVRADAGRIPEGAGQVALWFAGPAGLYLVARWLLPLLGVLYPIVVSLAIIITFVAVNMVFVGLMPVFERSATRLVRSLPQLAVATLLAAAELGLAAGLRAFVEGLV